MVSSHNSLTKSADAQLHKDMSMALAQFCTVWAESVLQSAHTHGRTIGRGLLPPSLVAQGPLRIMGGRTRFVGACGHPWQVEFAWSTWWTSRQMIDSFELTWPLGVKMTICMWTCGGLDRVLGWRCFGMDATPAQLVDNGVGAGGWF